MMALAGRLLYRNYRLVYEAGQWIRRHFSPGGILILGGMLASGIFGIDTRQSLAFQIFAITVSLLLVAAVSTLLLPGGKFRFHRKLPEYGTAGCPLKYKIIVKNPGKSRPHDPVLIDELAVDFPEYQTFRSVRDPMDRHRNWLDRKLGYPRLMSLIRKNRGGTLPAREIDPVLPGEEKEVDVEFIPLRRGYLHFSRTGIARTDPLGLFRSISSSENPGKLLILPAIYRVPAIRLEGHRKYQPRGFNQASAVGDSQEFFSLREYHPGDPIRSIHWRSYARLGEPVVKEYRDEYFVRQGLVLDTFAGKDSETRFEEAVSMAASFAVSIHDQDSLLDLMFVGTQSYRITTGRSFGEAANLLETLACVDPCIDRDVGQLETFVRQHADELSSLIVILLAWDNERQEMIRRLVSANIAVIVFVVLDDDSDRNLQAGPLEDTPARLIALPSGRIQETLDGIDWNTII